MNHRPTAVRALIRKLVVALSCSQMLGLTLAHAATADAPKSLAVIGNVRLQRTQFRPMLLPDQKHAAFGALLYDAKGELVLHEGDKSWLYTASLAEGPSAGLRDWYGKWVSEVREFNVRTLASGESKMVLGLSDADPWAVIHDVVEVSESLFVAFYSANGTIKAATSERPDGPFKPVHDFTIAVTDPWERAGGQIGSLESIGAHVLIGESDHALTLWHGYDSYHVDRTAGQFGWAKIRIDKVSGRIELISKDPRNPLPLLPKNYLAARCGGNLSANSRIDGKFVFLYYSRPNRSQIMLTAALSDDPLFRHVTTLVELEPPLGDETVIEKFESYLFDGELHVIYENQLASGRWGTGMRSYKILE